MHADQFYPPTYPPTLTPRVLLPWFAATVVAVEGDYAVNKGTLVSLSEEQIVQVRERHSVLSRSIALAACQPLCPCTVSMVPPLCR